MDNKIFVLINMDGPVSYNPFIITWGFRVVCGLELFLV